MSDSGETTQNNLPQDDDTETTQNKRPHDDDTDDTLTLESSDSDSFVFVKPITMRAPVKKRKVIPSATLLKSLPCAESYEKSYMHSDTITHCIVSASDFIITASCDGHIKFWKKIDTGIEFVRDVQSHLCPIVEIACNSEGTLLCSASLDKSLKIFDLINVDVINVLELDYVPGTVEWTHNSGDSIHSLAVSDKNSSKIYIYDGRSDGTPLKVLDKTHPYPVSLIKYNSSYDVAISADRKGRIEYWTGRDHVFPRNVGFYFKLFTDLYEFVIKKTYPCSLVFSPDGKRFATTSPDRKVRVFNFFTGKLIRVLDETVSRFTRYQQKSNFLSIIEFDRRIDIEKELDQSRSIEMSNIVFDESGYIIMYATVIGVKMINIHTNRCVEIIGNNETMRILNIALYQGTAKKPEAAGNKLEHDDEEESGNPILPDPTLICTAFQKSRFYLFSRREPDELQGRDALDDNPSNDDIPAASDNPDRSP